MLPTADAGWCTYTSQRRLRRCHGSTAMAAAARVPPAACSPLRPAQSPTTHPEPGRDAAPAVSGSGTAATGRRRRRSGTARRPRCLSVTSLRLRVRPQGEHKIPRSPTRRTTIYMSELETGWLMGWLRGRRGEFQKCQLRGGPGIRATRCRLELYCADSAVRSREHLLHARQRPVTSGCVRLC